MRTVFTSALGLAALIAGVSAPATAYSDVWPGFHPLASHAIPDEFHGVWARKAADCQYDNKVFIVDGDSVDHPAGEMFLSDIWQDDDDDDVVRIAFDNVEHGQHYPNMVVFSISDSNDNLTIQESGDDYPSALHRCD